ncbi:hypothetical protein STEG23_020169 [Scotinomys teguina]
MLFGELQQDTLTDKKAAWKHLQKSFCLVDSTGPGCVLLAVFFCLVDSTGPGCVLLAVFFCLVDSIGPGCVLLAVFLAPQQHSLHPGAGRTATNVGIL